jgi:hypothetical protein
MNKLMKTLIAGLALITFAIPLSAAAADQDELQKKIEQLSRELEALKVLVKETAAKTKEIDTVKQQVKVSEQKSLGRWLSVSGDYRFRYDNLKGSVPTYWYPNPAGGVPLQSVAHDVKSDSLYTNRFGLNLKAKATEDVTVTTRLLMYKTAGGQDDSALRTGNTAYSFDRAGLFDGTIGHVPGDSKLAVDRVYATWNNIADQPIWFSIGRRPSTGGVPSHLKENKQAPGNSGVPSLLVDYAFDGVTLGYAPEIDSLPGAYAKLCYGRGFQTAIEDVSAANNLKNTDMVGLNIVPYDTDRFRAELQYNRGMNIFDAPDMLNGPYTILAPATNLGDVDWYGLDFLGMVKSVGIGNLNWFVNGAISKTHPNDNKFMTMYGLLYTGMPEAKSGWAVYAGLRYDIPSTLTKIGVEYNHGSENWITFAPAADDMWTSKLGVRGSVYEVYIIQELKLKPISSFLSKTFFRLGYQHYEFDYTGSNSWLGAPIKISELNSPMAAQMTAPLKTAQDLYATFEVHF